MKKDLLFTILILSAASFAAALILCIYQGALIAAAVCASGFVLSLYAVAVTRAITAKIKSTAHLLGSIADGNARPGAKVDEIAGTRVYELTDAINKLLVMGEKKDAENRRLIEIIGKSKLEWEGTFDAIQDLISIHDKDYKVTRVNTALAKKFKCRPEELIGKSCHGLFYGKSEPKHFCPHTTTMLTGVSATAEREDFVFDGTYRVTTYPIFDTAGEVSASVHIMQDITQEKLLRHQLFNAEKLSTVGKLVGGIAHELNNPLMGIMGFSQLIMDTPGERPISEVKEKIKKIYNESLRTARIVQNLLTFARVKKSERGYHSLNEIIKQTLALREYSLKTGNIGVKLDLEADLPLTMLDYYQMQQIIINLLSNSEDSIVSAKKPGTIEIRTFRKKRKIYLTILDSGPGIPAEAIARIFDPFFTTKPVGKGTGLGLSIVHGIVVEHGGEILITSPEGGGTLAEIELPIVEKEQWDEVKKSVESGEGAALMQPSASEKRALVVEDDKSTREAVASILAAWNIKTDTARDGTEALHELDLRRYSILIMNVDMKVTGEKDLYSLVLDKHGYIKDRLLLIVGDAPAASKILDRTGKAYLKKPINSSEAAIVIKNFLV